MTGRPPISTHPHLLIETCITALARSSEPLRVFLTDSVVGPTELESVTSCVSIAMVDYA